VVRQCDDVELTAVLGLNPQRLQVLDLNFAYFLSVRRPSAAFFFGYRRILGRSHAFGHSASIANFFVSYLIDRTTCTGHIWNRSPKVLRVNSRQAMIWLMCTAKS